MNIRLSSIAAMADNRVIGKDGGLPWHLSEDLKYFKRTTMGKPMIMGRKSFEAFPKPLPGRAHIVISRSHGSDDYDDLTQDGVYKVSSIESALTLAERIAEAFNLDEIFVTGGGEIYGQTMDKIDRLYLTLIHKDYEGDTLFPDVKFDALRVVSKDVHEGDPRFTFLVMDRV